MGLLTLPCKILALFFLKTEGGVSVSEFSVNKFCCHNWGTAILSCSYLTEDTLYALCYSTARQYSSFVITDFRIIFSLSISVSNSTAEACTSAN
jgi:hypothetical protein